MRKLLGAIGVPILAIVVLAGCGSSSSSSSSTAASTPTTSSSASSSIAAQVPAAIKSKGTLTVAADATYAPNEFVASDGHTVIGMDADLMKALGEQMG
jgi:polar amino acid transport system substrate-binding protein